MWHTLATLELALGCLYPVIIACQHNFPPDAEVREAAFYSLQSYYTDKGYGVQLLQTRSGPTKNYLPPLHPSLSKIHGDLVAIFLPCEIVYVTFAENCLMVFLKEYASGIEEHFCAAHLTNRYWVLFSTFSPLLLGDWWQTVVDTLDSRNNIE